MPNFPIRNLGGAGIISDIHPYDLPPNVFSAGVNVRFENGTVSRGPVPREVFNLTDYSSTYSPGYILSVPPVGSSSEALVTVSRDYGSILSIIGSTVSDVTPTGVYVSDTGEPYTHSFLGGVTYLNRKSNVPFKLAASDTRFVALPNWDSSWRCGVLRAYKDFLIALNVKKGAIEYPSMIKWSDITQYGSAPPSWDHTLTTNSAGENILNEMKGPIVDGHILRDTFMIYGENEVWAMSYIGGQFIFDFRKRFDDVGVIAANCVVEVDGQHYVFDRNDIIVHDGASKKSLVYGTNKDFIFKGLIRDLQHLCFVTHNPRLNEILFCYPSIDRLVGFKGATKGCNRAAAFNYRNGSWTFYDLPNVTSSTLSPVQSGITYDGTGTTVYDAMGGTYAGDQNQSGRQHLFASDKDAALGISSSRVVGMDLLALSLLEKPVATELLKPAFAERIGIDMDEEGAQLSSYKSVMRVYPQIAIPSTTSLVSFQYGANDVSGVSPEWDDPRFFSPIMEHQINVRKAGRYLSHRVSVAGLSDFSYSGMDVTMTVRGKR